MARMSVGRCFPLRDEIEEDETLVYCAKPDGTTHRPYKKTDVLGNSTTGIYKDGNSEGTWPFLTEGEQVGWSLAYSNEKVYVGPLLGVEEGAASRVDTDNATADVAYKFAGDTSVDTFMLSRVVQAKALTAE